MMAQTNFERNDHQMVTIKEKTVVTTRLTADCPSHSRSDISVRDTSMTIDEPLARGGTNLGPSPTETAMAALMGCSNVIGRKIAEKLGLDVRHMKMSLACEFDRRGVTLQEEIDIPFQRIHLRVEVDGDVSQDDLQRLSKELSRYCPVAKLFRAAGTVIEEEWVVAGSS